MKKNQSGFSMVEVILVLIFITLVGFVGWYVWHSNAKDTKSSDGSVTSPSVQEQKQVSGVELTNDSLPFTLHYPNDWEVGSDNKTDYGFYSLRLQPKGTVIEPSAGGAVLKSGAELLLTKSSDQSTNPEKNVEEYSSNSQDAKFLKSKKIITVDGVKALEYDLDRTTDGGTSVHEVRFYKDSIVYVFDMDNQQYSQPSYKSGFDSIVKSIDFK
jgi:hypothetical protein